jgi:type IV fimbrial biogenesis protein FimT
MLGYKLMLYLNGRNGGFTLIELMVIVVVLAVTLSLAVPAVQEMLKNNRVTGQTNEMLALISFARNEAIRRNDSVTVSLNSTNEGWTAEVIDPLGEETGAEHCDTGVLRCASHRRVDLGFAEGDSLDLVFNNRGYLDPFQGVQLSMQHDPCTANQFQRRLITIRPTGQVESCRAGCDQASCE